MLVVLAPCWGVLPMDRCTTDFQPEKKISHTGHGMAHGLGQWTSGFVREGMLHRTSCCSGLIWLMVRIRYRVNRPNRLYVNQHRRTDSATIIVVQSRDLQANRKIKEKRHEEKSNREYTGYGHRREGREYATRWVTEAHGLCMEENQSTIRKIKR